MQKYQHILYTGYVVYCLLLWVGTNILNRSKLVLTEMVVGIGFRGGFFSPNFYIKKLTKKFQNVIFLTPKKLVEFTLDFQLPKNFLIFFLPKKKKKKKIYWLASCAFNSKIINSLSRMCELPNTTYPNDFRTKRYPKI